VPLFEEIVKATTTLHPTIRPTAQNPLYFDGEAHGNMLALWKWLKRVSKLLRASQDGKLTGISCCGNYRFI